jgi:hypothetical protein
MSSRESQTERPLFVSSLRNKYTALVRQLKAIYERSLNPDQRKALETWAQRSPLSLRFRTWGVIWSLSLVLGFLIYFAGMLWAYSSQTSDLLNAAPSEVAFLKTAIPQAGCSTSTLADLPKLYAAAFGVSSDTTNSALVNPLCQPSYKQFSAIPAITVVETLIHQDLKCGGNCSVECSEYWRERIARLLGGSLLSGEANLAMTPLPVSGAGDKCDIAEPLNLSDRFWGIFRKPSPISAPVVAQWLLGLRQCVGDHTDNCTLVTRLLQSALDNDGVRSSRRFVNMICGVERLLVLVLFFVLLFSLSYRSIVRRNLDDQKRQTIDHLASNRETSPSEALDWFEEQFPEGDDNEEFTPIRHLLRAAAKAGKKAADSLHEIDFRARIDSELIGQSRVVLDALITVFPVIGFAATLWGLIVALSNANLIASSIGDQRNANVMRVTSELSSCFSTTLLALICMTLFAVWSTLQAKREAALVNDVQECCLTAFR